MQKLSGTVLMGLLLIAPGAPAAKKCVEKEPKKSNKRHGLHIRCSGDKVQSETSYKEGKKHGKEKRYSSNGKISEVTTYRDGNRHGAHKRYRSDGKLQLDEIYKDGRLDGVQTEYDSNGKVDEQTSYRAGKKTGPNKEYSSGKLYRVTEYKDGKRHGAYKKYDSDGKIQNTGAYQQGKRKGWELEYYNNTDGHYLATASFYVPTPNSSGRRDIFVRFFANGGVDSVRCYDKSGKEVKGTPSSCKRELAKLEKLHKGKSGTSIAKASKDGDNEYYSNGKPSRICQVKNGVRHGDCKEFFKTGKVRWKAKYDNGKAVGSALTYWESGKLRARNTYSAPGVVKKKEEFFEDGSVKKDATIEGGTHETAAIEYYMNGKPRYRYVWKGKEKRIAHYLSLIHI